MARLTGNPERSAIAVIAAHLARTTATSWNDSIERFRTTCFLTRAVIMGFLTSAAR